MVYSCTAYSLHGCPFRRLASLPCDNTDFTKAQTLCRSLPACSVSFSVSLEIRGVSVALPAAHCSLGWGMPPDRHKENTPVPSLFQLTDKDAGMKGATEQKR